MKKPTIKQAGRIVCEGQLQLRFWARALGLEKTVTRAQEVMSQNPQRKSGMVPIVSEHRVDERLVFVFVLLVDIDQLGIKGGTGVIFYTSPEREKEIYKVRDDIADDILKSNQGEKWHEVVELIEDKPEADRLD
jgi:hypothetical protein